MDLSVASAFRRLRRTLWNTARFGCRTEFARCARRSKRLRSLQRRERRSTRIRVGIARREWKSQQSKDARVADVLFAESHDDGLRSRVSSRQRSAQAVPRVLGKDDAARRILAARSISSNAASQREAGRGSIRTARHTLAELPQVL